MTQHTPGPLRVIMRGPDHDAIITEAGDILANVNRQRRETTVSRNAAELVRRWNTHEVMLEALRDLVGQGDNGNYCDRCDSSLAEGHAEGCPIRAGEAALAAAEGPGDTQS